MIVPLSFTVELELSAIAGEPRRAQASSTMSIPYRREQARQTSYDASAYFGHAHSSLRAVPCQITG